MSFSIPSNLLSNLSSIPVSLLSIHVSLFSIVPILKNTPKKAKRVPGPLNQTSTGEPIFSASKIVPTSIPISPIMNRIVPLL